MGKKSRKPPTAEVPEKATTKAPAAEPLEVSPAPEKPELRSDEDLATEFDAKFSENFDAARALYVAAASAAQRLDQEHAKITAQKERNKMKAAIAEAAAQKAEAEKATLLNQLDKTTEQSNKFKELAQALQKTNKLIQEDADAKVQREGVLRKELSDKFSGSLEDLSAKMNEQNEARKTSLEENESLRTRLLDLLGKFEEQQKYFDSSLKTKDLELELSEAKRHQEEAVAAQEAAKAKAFEQQANTLAKTEAELRRQLTLYGSKFETFQKSIESSNEAFQQYRERLEGSAKAKKLLERESALQRARGDALETKVAKMTEAAKEMSSLRAQKVKLERLCRTLQAERAGMAAKLAAAEGKPTPSPPAASSPNGVESEVGAS